MSFCVPSGWFYQQPQVLQCWGLLSGWSGPGAQVRDGGGAEGRVMGGGTEGKVMGVGPRAG